MGRVRDVFQGKIWEGETLKGQRRVSWKTLAKYASAKRTLELAHEQNGCLAGGSGHGVGQVGQAVVQKWGVTGW
jgi:hypothetical protein